MKNTFFVVAIVLCVGIVSCKKDDGVSCTTCTSPQTANFEVCEESNGNASVNGENTGTPYEVYLQGLIEAGATCGM
ncbi:MULTISPECIES: hypothetical protein [Aequorivita]|uniref:Uncharacterized protein n=2 Tax=Aequorivita TaxID=153265 RepID=A0AB35YUB7_9FLAO|nr:hypothetical protein [Aequorivita sp. Ant34-E75]WGF93488.1 hypothetical protein QCQ61_04665 [Aequorivita sp. Ant34-E75]